MRCLPRSREKSQTGAVLGASRKLFTPGVLAKYAGDSGNVSLAQAAKDFCGMRVSGLAPIFSARFQNVSIEVGCSPSRHCLSPPVIRSPERGRPDRELFLRQAGG